MIGLPVIIFVGACVVFLFLGPVAASIGRFWLFIMAAIAIGIRVMLP